MDYIISFFLSFFSFFIISHFIYRIFSRKQWSYIFLGVVLLSSFFDFIQYVTQGYETTILVYVFMSRVLPIIFAAILFTKMTGGFQLKKIRVKKTKYKDPNEDIFTTSYLKKVIYFVSLISIAIGFLSYFFIDDILQYILMGVSLLVILFGIYKLYTLRYFKQDKIILIVGKQKEYIYEMTINQTSSKLQIEDVYVNENYLIDKFATVHIYEQHNIIEKHYLFWIATQQVFEIDDPKFKKIELEYKDHIANLMKYHDAIIKLEKHKRSYTLMKEKKYKK